MQILHEASDMLQAHLLADLLQRAGVPAHVQGDYLQGAAGLLPVSGLVQVVTQENDGTYAENQFIKMDPVPGTAVS